MTFETIATKFAKKKHVILGTIILFSQRTLTGAEQRLNTFTVPAASELEVITFPATADDVLKFVEACVQAFQGEVEQQPCFVVKRTVLAVVRLDGQQARSLPIEITAESSATTLFVTYELRGAVTITS